MSTNEIAISETPALARPTAAPRASMARGLIYALCWNVPLALIALTMALPFIWMVLTSLKPLSEVGLANWLPGRLRWGNYARVFQVIDFARYYWNSIFVASWITFLQVLTSAMAAFAFSRLQWPGRNKMFLLYLATIMLPGLVMVIPNYWIMIELHLVNSFTGLILPLAFGPFGVFLLRQFMLTIPPSLDESARMDGAGPWRIFWDITMPLSRPGLITLTIFTFMGTYQNFFWPLVMLKSQSLYTLPIGLLYFNSTSGQATNLLMAAVTMSIAPLVVIFIILQKYIVKGIQIGAVKG